MTKDEISQIVLSAIEHQAGLIEPPQLADTMDDLYLDSLDVATVEISIEDRMQGLPFPATGFVEGKHTVAEVIDLVAKHAKVTE